MTDTLQQLRLVLARGGGDTKWEDNLAKVSDKPIEKDQTFAIFIQKLRGKINGPKDTKNITSR